MQPDLNALDAVNAYLQFVPMENETLDFFKSVASNIHQMLKSKPCLPTEPDEGRFTLILIQGGQDFSLAHPQLPGPVVLVLSLESCLSQHQNNTSGKTHNVRLAGQSVRQSCYCSGVNQLATTSSS